MLKRSMLVSMDLRAMALMESIMSESGKAMDAVGASTK
jgi:hypothetical protein